MSPQTTADNLNSRVDQLDISGGRSPECTFKGGKLIFMPKTLTRNYILTHQPWDSISLPQQYLPIGKQLWFPPLFYLGVPLTIEELFRFACHLGLIVRKDNDSDMYAVVAHRLSQICGFTGPDSPYPSHRVAVKVCDTNKGRPWMLTLVSNYQITEGLDYGEPFSAMADALNEAFGGSKKLEWWLEHTLNHTPKDYMWVKLKPQWVHDWDKMYDDND